MFKIGDKIKIKSKKYFDNLNDCSYPIFKKNIYFQFEMLKYCNTIVTIIGFDTNGNYIVKENLWSWGEWMIKKYYKIDENGNYLLEFENER